jgi:dTDP-4-dehydrorhamnose 3,5-epimerase
MYIMKDNFDIPSSVEEFIQDKPLKIASSKILNNQSDIDGVKIEQLNPNCDKRGCLIELLTTREELEEPIVHVYKVEADAGSKRGWVYHKWQKDRLVFTESCFNIYLKDVRKDSQTFGKEMTIQAGIENKIRLTIPPFVAHRVDNIGINGSFINMPTNFYDPKNPDKFRFTIND